MYYVILYRDYYQSDELVLILTDREDAGNGDEQSYLQINPYQSFSDEKTARRAYETEKKLLSLAKTNQRVKQQLTGADIEKIIFINDFEETLEEIIL